MHYIDLLRLLFFAALVGLAPCAESPLAFRTLGDTIVNEKFDSMPRWRGGLVGVIGNATAAPRVRVFDADGRLTADVEVRIAQAARIVIPPEGAAHGRSGAIAICVSATDANLRTDFFLVLANADGKIERLIETTPYFPDGVAIAPDGTIWTAGRDLDPANPGPSKQGIIRHFDASGTQLADFLPQSSLRGFPRGFLGNALVAANSTITGWYQNRSTTSYFEVSQGRVEEYPVVKLESDLEMIFGLAIMDSGAVFVTKARGAFLDLYMLDRKTRTWIRVAGPEGGSPAVTNRLLGGEGKTLVFVTTEGIQHLRRFNVGNPLQTRKPDEEAR